MDRVDYSIRSKFGSEGLFFQRSRCISLIMTFCDIRAALAQVNLMEMPHHGNYCNLHSEDLPRNYQLNRTEDREIEFILGRKFRIEKRRISNEFP